jgi:lysophospholipase L1-like esterase
LSLTSGQAYGSKPDILLIGDSLAVGLTKAFERESGLQHFSFNSYSIGGTNTRQWANNSWIDKATEKSVPEWAFVVLGTNDAAAPSWKKDFPENAARVVDRLNEKYISVAWITPPKIRINTDFIADGASKAHPEILLDFRSFEFEMMKDHIHLTSNGYIRWCNSILGRFEEYGY